MGPNPNQPAGAFFVDAFPGLSLALASDPVLVTANVTLTTGEAREIAIQLPTPDSLLVVKLLAWKDRHARKDAIDIWRLLAVCHGAGLRPDSWHPRGARKDALEQLALLTRPNGMALKLAQIEGQEALALRALAQRVLGL